MNPKPQKFWWRFIHPNYSGTHLLECIYQSNVLKNACLNVISRTTNAHYPDPIWKTLINAKFITARFDLYLRSKRADLHLIIKKPTVQQIFTINMLLALTSIDFLIISYNNKRGKILYVVFCTTALSLLSIWKKTSLKNNQHGKMNSWVHIYGR